MEAHFYVHLSSADSKQYFSKNDTSRFTMKLPEILHLKGLLVCSDLCGESIIGEKRLPLLRVLTGRIPTSFEPLQYIPVRLQETERVTIYINSETGDPASFVAGDCDCTLHLKHV